MPDLKSLEAYITSDEASLLRHRAILQDCDPATPAHALAEATIAEYERALQGLYRRRATLIARLRENSR
jgi:hypothetical protein